MRLVCGALNNTNMINDLFSAVRAAAEGLGYSFFAGNALAVAGRINSFPAVWLTPPKLMSASGREERTNVYRVSICFMMEAAPRAQEEAWEVLQADARELCALLNEGKAVERVFNIRCTPNAKPLSHHGELGVTAEFDAQMFSCR